jgi:hypothetical protein
MDLGVRFFVSTRASLTSMRAEAVKVGVAPTLRHGSPLPSLDGFEHDSTLNVVAMTIRGSPLSGAVQSRHNLVSGRSKDPEP